MGSTFKKISDSHRENSGATMIEAAIALPIFFVFILSTIEILWFFHVKITLESAAQQAVDLATKLPMENSITLADCSSPDTAAGCAKFRDALNLIAKKGNDIANLVAKPSSNANAAVSLKRFQYYNQADYSQSIGVPSSNPAKPDQHPLKDWENDIAIVRPGEAVRYKFAPGLKWPHPVRPDDLGVDTVGWGWPNSQRNETWDQILSENPIAVHIEATYYPLTPFFKIITGPLNIIVTQYGYRNSGQKGISAPLKPSTRATPPPPSVPNPTPTPEVCPAINKCSGDPDYCCTHSDAFCLGNCRRTFGCTTAQVCTGGGKG